MKKKLLIFIVAYNATKTIQKLFSRIPNEITRLFDTEILVIDDSSQDNTFQKSFESKFIFRNQPIKLKILKNPINFGYGGNQKIGYHYAIKNRFDYVALLHGDGQYPPEYIIDLLNQFKLDPRNCAIFGSRMMNSMDALKGGMPIYKWLGNKILTWLQNKLLNSNLSEFHSGYRIYSVKALSEIPFELNSDDFHFDTEIIIQFLLKEFKIKEIPIPTFYGDEVCYVNGFKYACNVLKAVFVAKLQQYSLIYDSKYDIYVEGSSNYRIKKNFLSTHSFTLMNITKNSSVLDLGCSEASFSEIIESELNCKVTGIDSIDKKYVKKIHKYIKFDLNNGLPKNLNLSDYQYILLLDVIEHLKNPEEFIQNLRKMMQSNLNIKLIASTGNIAFFIQRLMLFIGQFNYGRRGILDITHSRLFTFNNFKSFFLNQGFEVTTIKGIPAPYPLAIKNKNFSRLLLIINNFLLKIFKSLFSYQVIMIIKAKPNLETLLKNSITYSNELKRNLKI